MKELGENAFLQPIYPESEEEGDYDHLSSDENQSSPGSSEDWEGCTDAGQCSTPGVRSTSLLLLLC